jgi:hypothetical protein
LRDELKAAREAFDEVRLSRALDDARRMGDDFVWEDELCVAEQALLELTAMDQNHG